MRVGLRRGSGTSRGAGPDALAGAGRYSARSAARAGHSTAPERAAQDIQSGRRNMRVDFERSDSRTQPFGEWRCADITTDVIEQFQRRRSAVGIVAANRDLGILRACFN